MSQLRSVLDQMASVPSESLGVGDLHAEIEEITRARERLDVLLADRIKGLTDQGGHVILGYSSSVSLLAATGRMAPSNAKRIVALANGRDRAPDAYAAWSDSRISTDQFRHLVRAAETVPDQYESAEGSLVEIVEGLDVVDTGKAVEYWIQSVDGPGDVDLESQMARRGFHLSKTFGGMRRIDGWLTPTVGAALEAAVEALMPPPRQGDERTPAQRRHDAVGDLCRDWLDHADTPIEGGEKPHIMVLSDIDALRGIAGGIHETTDGEVIDVTSLRALACDSSVSRIVLGPDSEIIDIGRKTRVWTTAQRRAVVARDRHCQAPGCRARPRHCDIHHLVHWADGGLTSVENGKLLCRFHHTRQHISDRLRRRERFRT